VERVEGLGRLARGVLSLELSEALFLGSNLRKWSQIESNLEKDRSDGSCNGLRLATVRDRAAILG
jgi:hypothetical protein